MVPPQGFEPWTSALPKLSSAFPVVVQRFLQCSNLLIEFDNLTFLLSWRFISVP